MDLVMTGVGLGFIALAVSLYNLIKDLMKLQRVCGKIEDQLEELSSLHLQQQAELHRLWAELDLTDKLADEYGDRLDAIEQRLGFMPGTPTKQ